MPTLASIRPSRAVLAAAASGACGLGVAALALPSSESLLEQAFARSFAATAPAPARVIADEADGTALSARLWLTRAEPATAMLAAAVGERITLTVDGGSKLDLEVVSVTEIAPASGTVDGDGKLAMVTLREVSGTSEAPRIVRLIVDADTPLSGVRGGPAHRAL